MRNRERGRLRELVDAHRLPRSLRRLVLRTVEDTRLWRWEREEVAEELACHLAEGLSAGREPEDLAAEFGDPHRAAELITRARRRKRPPAVRLAILSLRAAAACVMAALAVYVVSAVRLYSVGPVVDGGRSHRALESGSKISWTWDEDEAAVPRASWERLDWGAIWPWEAVSARREVGRADGMLDTSRRLAAAGDRVGALGRIEGALGVAADLQVDPTLPGWLAAVSIRVRAVDALQALNRDSQEIHDSMGLGSMGPAAPAVLSSDPQYDLEVVRRGLDDLFDRLYAADGRLTGRGLRSLQSLMGKADPGTAALILEPALFSFPANRAEVRGEAERLLAMAELDRRLDRNSQGSRLRRELGALRGSPRESLRLIPIALVLPSIADALRASEDSRDRLRALTATVPE